MDNLFVERRFRGVAQCGCRIVEDTKAPINDGLSVETDVAS